MSHELSSIPTQQLLEHLVNQKPFSGLPNLAMVSLGGSQQNQSQGVESDIDVFTIMAPNNPSKVDIEAIIGLAFQIGTFCNDVARQTHMVPVVIATIRLEEAQIELGRLLNPDKSIVPLHWLHHPSVEFLLTNEPPELAANLLKSRPIMGTAPKPTAPIPHLGGLDWLTDSFRILVANFTEDSTCPPRQPLRFLLKHALHNLDYFWKWRIVPQHPHLKSRFDHIHALRHKGESADIQQVIDLHRETFDLWPIK